MKKMNLCLMTIGLAVVGAPPAMAADLMVAAAMQRCDANEECQLVTNSCADNCAYVPVNKGNMTILGQQYQERCGKPMDAAPKCSMTPPISAACINHRCTIDYPFAHNAGPKDYESGAYPVAEKPAPDMVKGDYSKVNDRNGKFTAYDLPQEQVKKKDIGQIVTKTYVPASAPVSGENYVPVGTTAPQPAPAMAPAMAPAVAPAPAPAPAPVAIPPTPSAPAMVAPAAPTPPAAAGYVAPPPMTPSVPNQAPYEYVAPQPPQAMPTPSTPVIPSVGAPGVPVAPAGSVPIPPSDLKPAPSLVAPEGTTVPKEMDKTGAVTAPVVMPDVTAKPAVKSFSGTAKAKIYN